MNNAVLLFIATNHIVVVSCGLCTYYSSVRYTERCGTFGWSRCGHYRQTSYQACCPGYSPYTGDCFYPICNGYPTPLGGCREVEPSDAIYYRTGTSRNNGGGTCESPDVCTDCQDGFYANGARCTICPKISNCKHRRCNSTSDNYCEWCEDEIKDKPFWRAYTRWKDGQIKECRQTCSWRSDSTRCFPGICSDEVIQSCVCTEGFGGHHCDTITNETSVLYAEIKLHSTSNEILTTPVDPNDPGTTEPIRWTNNRNFIEAEFEFHAKYIAPGTPPDHDPNGDKHYVIDFKYGIIYGVVTVDYIRSKVNVNNTYLRFDCPGNEDYPINVNYNCSRHKANNSQIILPAFNHSDQLVFSVEVRNGGYLKYIDRSNNITIRSSLHGLTSKRSYIIQWDYIDPYHTCLQQLGEKCTVPPLELRDVTDTSTILLSWRQWTDNLAGIHYYEYEVYDLQFDGNSLKEGSKVASSNSSIPYTQSESEFNVTTPGMYAIIFSVFDKAGNHKSTRSAFLYDDQSIVETTPGTRIIVKQSTVNTNFTWVVTNDIKLNVTWPGRFTNERHHVRHWLCPLKPNQQIDNLYDDKYGNRTSDVVTNVLGVVKFDINYTVTGPNITSFQTFTNVNNILPEAEVINVAWEDGQKLDISVRATDILWEFAEDTVTIFKDTTHSEIQNLWLTRDDKVNISVHHIEDFTNMSIEWDTFDYHSGIESVHWRLFDNFTGKDILHGQSYLHTQGNTENMTDCKEKYKESPRGSDCYCTLYHGCFHRHFHVQPKVVNGSGLTPGKDKGVHDSDYFIEVTVVNKAMLSTMLTKKITIDISPPHTGHVQDGLPGQPEIDYQQSLHLNVHWNGFFDPESGVKYYKYVFFDRCLDKTNLTNVLLGIETYNTFASYDALREGTFYVSVVAVNSANEASEVVCSDGVTINTATPTVKDVNVKDIKTMPRLIVDRNSIVWYLDKSLRKSRLKTNCSGIPLYVDDEKIYEEMEYLKFDCSDLAGQSSEFLSILPRSSQLLLSWKDGIQENLVYDYEIGLSSTKDSPAPDIFPFKSSNHHRHFRLNSPDLEEGRIFYIVIRSVSKSDMTGIQSVGPIIIDATGPTFVGEHIDLRMKDNALIANWSAGAFYDKEDTFPMDFKYSLGHEEYGSDVQSYLPLSFSHGCLKTSPPTCTAIDVSMLHWSLHAHHTYFVTIQTTNIVGLTTTQTSLPYIHDVRLPSPGIVYDLYPSTVSANILEDNRDIDFSDVQNALAVEWRGFYHPHLPLSYKICAGTMVGSCEIAEVGPVNDSQNHYVFGNILLHPSQTYYVTVRAVTSSGTVNVSSDGVTIINNTTKITGIDIKDGYNCSGQILIKSSHHERDVIPQCQDDVDFQTSTTTLRAYWNIPVAIERFITKTFYAIEVKSPVGDYWSKVTDFTLIGNVRQVTVGNLDLQPGLTYRIKIKFCSGKICLPVISSNGVTVIPSKPVTGSLFVNTESNKLIVTVEKMYDPDIEDEQEAIDAVDVYEWVITDGTTNNGLYTKWKIVNNSISVNKTHLKFDVPLIAEISIRKCKQVLVKGLNKAGVSSDISREIKSCTVYDGPRQITPSIVIDAIGKHDPKGDVDKASGIYYKRNTAWMLPDADYTPYVNVISAVWPTLRHEAYIWGVIQAKINIADKFYKAFSDILVNDPCTHPDVIACGTTEEEYVNVFFNKSLYLQHGKRYVVCIHAKKTEVQYEKWTETLEEVNSCSDGVTVDLTPPTPGNVNIGSKPDSKFQTSSSDIFISWDSFTDVEEFENSMHSTGISSYYISVGSTKEGVDIVDNMNVGVTNHVVLHGLNLQNGHQYFVKLTAFDFLNRRSSVNADPMTVDVSPPVVTSNSITIKGRHLTNLSAIEACWTDVFVDPESGIDHYIWGLGSDDKQDDAVQFSLTSQECDMSSEEKSYELIEGHPYFVTVKAFNRAGLVTTSSSWAYIFDMSPPIAGHVYDGDYGSSQVKDIDYQTDMTKLSSYWEGFHDPHTVIKNYFIQIGTCHGCDDVVSKQYTGFHTHFTLSNVHLKSGIRYFTTVTACNTADLCTIATSDGVIIDNNPPTVGLVQDGTEDDDIEYQSVRNHITTKWHGFTDAQSSIDYFVVRVGTKPGSGDVISPIKLPVTDIWSKADIVLPLNYRLYVTVRAYNKAGLFSESTSNGFIIDISAPSIVQRPYLSSDLGSTTQGSQVTRSVMKIKWNVEDIQSSIARQYLSIATHSGGEFNATSTQLNGIDREYIMANLDLHDGGMYSVKLIVCNGAKVCVETKHDNILVDSSPPTPGMFAISTYHAAELGRHTPDWMTWSEYRLNMSWLGFADIHSGIERYFVSVGSEYMANDLNKIPGRPMEFIHNETSAEYRDEGHIQYFVVPTQRLSDFKHVFVSVWAVNKVGLWSAVIHSQFQLIPGGFLDLIRRCSALTCIGHCVCSSRNSHCTLNGNSCQDVSYNNSNTLIEVFDVLDLMSPATKNARFTPSNTFLACKWMVTKNQGLSAAWYEWSVGLATKDKPEGVINSLEEPVWNYAGKRTEAVYNLNRDSTLKELVAYSIFVRVWYDRNIYAVFKSPGITVLSKPIPVNDLQGAAVVEKLPGFWKSDVDFIKPGSLFTVSWKNVFLSFPNSMKQFNLYLSSFPGGSDLQVIDVDIANSVTEFNISRLSILSSVRYYSNVKATSLSGLQTTVSSDGFVFDSSPPVPGIVYDGIGLHDTKYQNTSNIVAARWLGFMDALSGITKYTWCVGSLQEDSVCDVLPWRHVGIHTQVSSRISTSMADGAIVYSKVIAEDAVGHKTPIKSSSGVTIDTSPPEPIIISHSNDTMVMNPSFEKTEGCFVQFENISLDSFYSINSCAAPMSWNKSNIDFVTVMRSYVDTAYDGRSFVFVKGQIHQLITGLKPGEIYRLTFAVSHSPVSSAVLSNLEGIVRFNNVEHIFMIFSKDKQQQQLISWHLQTFYFKPNGYSAELVIGNLDRNSGFLLDNVLLNKVLKTNDVGERIHVHVVALNQWSSIHSSWYFEDIESPITEYFWAIGYTEGSAEVQRFTSVGVNTFGFNYNVTLIHSSKIYVTVVAINAAGLSSRQYSSTYLVDLTPPTIVYVYDGTDSDVDGQITGTISVNWEVNDPESGIDFCEWSIGLRPFGNDLMVFTQTSDKSKASATLDKAAVNNQKIYTTIRCHNNAGLHYSATSDGVIISDKPPSADHAVVEMLTSSLTEYSTSNQHQDYNKQIRVKWSGFYDPFSIMSFYVRFRGTNNEITHTIINTNNDVTFLTVTGMDFLDDIFVTSVSAVNTMYLRSTAVTQNMTVLTSAPKISGVKVSTNKNRNTVIVNWKGSFTHKERLIYEISVGTTLGGADVVQWQETLNHYIEIEITEKLKTQNGLKLYYFIRAIGVNGEYASINSDIDI